MKVIRDAGGVAINIGEWDFSLADGVDLETGEEIRIIGNPLPDGSSESDEDVVTGWDGGLYILGDPRANRSD